MEDYNQFYKPKQPTLGSLVNKYYDELKDELCDELRSELEELIKSRKNHIDSYYEICDCDPMGILCYPYFYPRDNFCSVQAESLYETWDMSIDIENWQEEALPSEWKKNTAPEKQVIKYILSEYDSKYRASKFLNVAV